MKLSFFRRTELVDSERQLCQLLLAGESSTLEKLRQQLTRPFLLDVERSRVAKRYRMTIIYDGALIDEFSAGSIEGTIDDLVVLDRRVSAPIRVRGIVHGGVMGNIFAEAPVSSWPRYLRVDDWHYVHPASGRDLKARQSAPVFREQREVAPLSSQTIQELRALIPATSLLRPEDRYFLEVPESSPRLLVVGLDLDGSPFCLAMERDPASGCSLVLVNHETGEQESVGRISWPAAE